MVQMEMARAIAALFGDPDFNIWRGSELIHQADTPFPGEETSEVRLPAGEYVFEVFDFLNISGNGLRRGDSCYNFTVTG